MPQTRPFGRRVLSVSASSASQSRLQTVTEISEAESLLALDNASCKRIYSNVFVDNRKVHFLLDCGCTVSLLPRSSYVQHVLATLRMYDATTVPTVGMITATVRHPRTGQQFSVEFYVTYVKFKADCTNGTGRSYSRH